MKTAGDSPRAFGGSQGAFPRERALARRLPWIAVPCAIALVLLLARRSDVVGLMHDDGVYLSMARSIEAGLGPVDGHMLPEARTSRFPPLHPLALAIARPLLGVAREGLDGVRRLVALNGAWLGIALFAFLRLVLSGRGWPAPLALCAAAFLFTLPYLIGLAQHPMSECLFLAELCVALLAYERARERGTRGALAVAGLLAGLLPATRTAGAAIVAGLAAHALVASRSWRRVAIFSAAALVPWVASAAWSFASRDVAIADSPLLGPSYGRLLAAHLGDLPWIAWVNFVRLLDDVVGLLATPAPPAGGIASAAARGGLGLAALAWIAIAAARAGARRARPELFALAAYLLILLPWPFTSVRFLVPAAPLLVLALVESAGAKRAAAAAASVLCLGLAAWNAPLVAKALSADRDEVPFFFAEPVPVAPLSEAAAWLERSTAPQDLFASTLDPTLHFLARRPGVSAWANDQVFYESYFDRAARGRELYGGLASRSAAQQLFEQSGAILAEYRRLGVRHVVVIRAAAERTRAAGSPLYDALADHLVRTHAPTARFFERTFSTSDGSIEIWRFDADAR